MKQNKTAIFFIIFLMCALAITTVLSIFVGPILLGFLVSYLLNPVFVYLERKGISRNTSAIVSIILIIILFSTLVWVVLPIVISQIQVIISHLPDVRDFIDQKVFPKLQSFVSKFSGTTKEVWSIHSVIPIDYQKISNAIIQRLGEGTRIILISFLFIVTVPIFMFIFMKHLPKFYTYINSLVPFTIRSTFVEFFTEVDQKLRSVLRGQIFVVLIMTVLYPIAFLIAGLPAAIGIGVLVGLARIVSGLDTVVALTLGSIAIVIYGSSYSVIFGSLFAFGALQALDMFVINPRIMGKYSGLHPVLILISVVVFAYWFGIYGVLVAIPVVTILKVAFQRLIAGYKKTTFFME